VAQDQQHRPRLRALPALADRVERSRERARGEGYVEDEVPTDVAIVVVLVGVLCSVVGWRVAPESNNADVAESWYALAISTLFWMAALIAAIGLYLRLRRGLHAALVCAMSFLGAVAIDAVLDSSIVGVRWGVELGCAVVFWLVCAGALILNDRLVPASPSRRRGRSARRPARRPPW
jgi:hypothetical protein